MKYIGVYTSLYISILSRFHCAWQLDGTMVPSSCQAQWKRDRIEKYNEVYTHQGRDLVRSFRKDCARCRILAKCTVEVVMGPVSKVNLTLAPAFCISQVDLFGPFRSYSVHNKRATSVFAPQWQST